MLVCIYHNECNLFRVSNILFELPLLNGALSWPLILVRLSTFWDPPVHLAIKNTLNIM